MPSKLLESLCDFTTEAHTRIQKDFCDIDPIVGVSQSMRKSGVPADAMTIDCLRTNKRIIIVLHDDTPSLINLQFGFRDKDPASDFEQLPAGSLSADLLYGWMSRYFNRTS